MSGPLADHLTGGSGSERILLELEDANAFVTSLDVGRTWFRSHHLFADLLQLELRRTAPTIVDALHRSAAEWHERGRDVPRGDGRAVVLVPGFGGGDHTLAALSGWLRRIGYHPAVCGFVINADCSARALERVKRRVAALHARSGRRVAVIGHSRGGHLARAVAARRPELASHAVSLGADLQSRRSSPSSMSSVRATPHAWMQAGGAVVTQFA